MIPRVGLASSDAFKELVRQGVERRWEKRLDEAAQLFRQALAVAEEADEELNIAHALGWLAIVRAVGATDEDTLAEALAMHERGLEIEERLAGPTSLRVADTSRLIGEMLARMNRPAEAVARFERATTIFRSHGSSSQSARDAMADLARLLLETGAVARAIETSERLVELCASGEASATELQIAHFTWGRALVEAQRGGEAVAHFERVLELAASRIAEGRAQRLTAEVETWLARARATS